MHFPSPSVKNPRGNASKPHFHNDSASIVALGGLVVQWCNGVTQRGGGSLGRGFQRALLEPFSAVSRLSGEWPNAPSLGRGFQRALLEPSSAVSGLSGEWPNAPSKKNALRILRAGFPARPLVALLGRLWASRGVAERAFQKKPCAPSLHHYTFTPLHHSSAPSWSPLRPSQGFHGSRHLHFPSPSIKNPRGNVSKTTLSQ